MNQQIKKYFSFLFLFLFLFPTVEKQLHAFEHVTDQHCNATDKHFHNLEHSCSICDFNVTNTNATFETETGNILSFQTHLFTPFIQSVNILPAFSNLPSRAPPIV